MYTEPLELQEDTIQTSNNNLEEVINREFVEETTEISNIPTRATSKKLSKPNVEVPTSRESISSKGLQDSPITRNAKKAIPTSTNLIVLIPKRNKNYLEQFAPI